MEKIKTTIESLTSHIKKDSKFNVKQKECFFSFLEIFYAQSQHEDFKEYSLNDLKVGAVNSYDNFLKRSPGESIIKVHNDENLRHTSIEIVNDDSPFLVDSIVAQLDELGIEMVNIIHPIFLVSRDESGNLTSISKSGIDRLQESVIQIHIKAIHSEEESKVISDRITKVIKNIKLVVEDFAPMVELAVEGSRKMSNKNLTKESSDFKEFINWLINGNFIFLGAIKLEVCKKEGKYSLTESGVRYGVCRSEFADFKPNVANISHEEIFESIENPYHLEVLKSSYKSQIHRIANAERIRIQGFSENGDAVCEYRFIGLFTSSAYNQSANLIPLIKNKISAVIEKSGFSKDGHNYKDIVSVLESYPRDELFQISIKDLLRISTGVVSICGRKQVRLFSRVDKFSRFVSCLVYLPRNRNNSQARQSIKSYLEHSYCGKITDYYAYVASSSLLRLHLIIRIEGDVKQVDIIDLEKGIDKLTRVWSDNLREELLASFPEKDSYSLLKKYKEAFSISYTDKFDASEACLDIKKIEYCLEKNLVLFNLYKSKFLPEDISELKIYSPNKEIILSDIMPLVESFGFNMIHEHTYAISPDTNSDKVWIHHFHLNLSKSGDVFNEEIKRNFEETISLIWTNNTGSGLLNRLIIAANLSWRQINLLRAYMRYIYQIGFKYNQKYISDVLVKNREITKLLVTLFETKFNPDQSKSTLKEKLIGDLSLEIKKLLNKVTDLSEDSVIRKFLTVIEATNRTNYFQLNSDGDYKKCLSFKFNPKNIPNLPLPVPFAEIYVYSAKVEGVHLRGGEVARGGLRWSDRNEDFRTEVLGLMKAQMTKNTVIVPVGSKGGFIVKKSSANIGRDEFLKEGIECYKTFLRGILDITDNVIDGKVIHPANTIIYDAQDPYLVVAADKGTATFSDVANAISAEYNFWLGDAFASGGSVGYDHKKMGITAKGAWISVQRHFRELGLDTQKEDFTCVGIGDLAGDVFGNGMLMSEHIKLVAAFNHLHIFLDPNPNSKESYEERSRMFNLPRSSWMDYNQKLISKGGGIFDRSAKTITLSPEVMTSLGIEEQELSPNNLIKAILKAPVDLLWNGGIGTYVKSSEESNQEAGDRVNDTLRINGSELRCRVIGEGGNLGFTQKGRIEYALTGGKINTDAMDNSAGVDCSDHEVNIKIALTEAIAKNKITILERNKILESMTDEVSELVLYDNKIQTQAITINEIQGVDALDYQSQFLDKLEKERFLNREVEFLPSQKEISKRKIDRIGLTRPELCVMLAYCKMFLYSQILESNLVEDNYFEDSLLTYFPTLMQKDFLDEIKGHQLRKSIIATKITNFVVNHSGITFVTQTCQDNGFAIVDVVRSFIIAYDSFRLHEVWKEIEKFDNKASSDLQAEMFLSMNRLLERSVIWLLHNQNDENNSIKPLVERLGKITDEFINVLPEALSKASKVDFYTKVKAYNAHNIQDNLVTRIAAMDFISSTFDIAEITAKSDFTIKTIAQLYFLVGDRFDLNWMRENVASINSGNYWDKLSTKTILEDLYSIQTLLTRAIINFYCKKKDAVCNLNSLAEWINHNSSLVERFDSFILDLKSETSRDISIFVVAVNRLKALCSI